jgi:DNA-binding MarR family transcriptional regulator
VPIAAVAFALTWLLKEVPLRQSAGVPDQAQALAPTADVATRDTDDEIMRALSLLAHKEDRVRVYGHLAEAASLHLDARSTWMLLRFDGRSRVNLTVLAGRWDMTTDQLGALLDPLVQSGLVTVAPALGGDSSVIAELTASGTAAIERLVEARRDGLTRLLGSWSDELDHALVQRIEDLARDLLQDPARRRLFLQPASTGSGDT